MMPPKAFRKRQTHEGGRVPIENKVIVEIFAQWCKECTYSRSSSVAGICTLRQARYLTVLSRASAGREELYGHSRSLASQSIAGIAVQMISLATMGHQALVATPAVHLQCAAS